MKVIGFAFLWDAILKYRLDQSQRTDSEVVIEILFDGEKEVRRI